MAAIRWRATAVERSGDQFGIYHAFLHLLRLDDGYDEVMPQKPHLGCEECWAELPACHRL